MHALGGIWNRRRAVAAAAAAVAVAAVTASFLQHKDRSVICSAGINLNELQTSIG
jgi:hypothetical protein